jgi:DTW domain-containing protein YfiP
MKTGLQMQARLNIYAVYPGIHRRTHSSLLRYLQALVILPCTEITRCKNTFLYRLCSGTLLTSKFAQHFSVFNMPSIIKRISCSRCLRPQSTCICHWITPVEHEVEVLFLQHPLEVSNAKGSARLLHLSLPHSRLLVGETFAEEELHRWLYAAFPDRDSSASTNKNIRPILLYPDTPEDLHIAVPPPFDPVKDEAVQYRLVVLDGTWRKSRKMLYLNPLLQQLPRLPLADPPASHYTIRKAHKPDQLSSFEASCYALMQLEQNEERYLPLLAAFDGFVAQQQAYSTPRTS